MAEYDFYNPLIVLGRRSTNPNPNASSTHVTKVARVKFKGKTYKVGESYAGFIVDDKYQSYKSDSVDDSEWPKEVRELSNDLINKYIIIKVLDEVK